MAICVSRRVAADVEDGAVAEDWAVAGEEVEATVRTMLSKESPVALARLVMYVCCSEGPNLETGPVIWIVKDTMVTVTAPSG